MVSTLQHNFIEGRRQALQAELDRLKLPSDRNRLGQFATPAPLALDIARFIEPIAKKLNRGIRFADPAVGTGSFFSAALDVFGQEGLESALGIEIDPQFAEASRTLWAEQGLKVVETDFTRFVAAQSRTGLPNLILANPPYVRHHHIDRIEKERLKQLVLDMTGIEINGLAGLYVYFLLLATAWMEEDGIAAWLIPSEFMDVNYGRALKEFLTDRVTLFRVHRFDPEDVQFGDALVSSAVLVFRKRIPPSGHAVEFSFGGSLVQPHTRDLISADRLRISHKWTTYPAHRSNDRRSLSGSAGPMLGDLFRIQRGIATGKNSFFILERVEALRLGIPAQYLQPILPSPRHLKQTVVEVGDDGYPLISPQLCVLDCDLPEACVEARYPAFWDYLKTAAKLGVMEGYLVGKRTPWYKQEQRAPAPFLCTYMGRGADDERPFRFIWNQSRAIGTNLYLMLYPCKALATILRQDPHCAEEIHSLLSQISGHELRGEGRVYGGGLNKIEPSELGRISAAPFIKRWPELAEIVKRERQESLF